MDRHSLIQRARKLAHDAGAEPPGDGLTLAQWLVELERRGMDRQALLRQLAEALDIEVCEGFNGHAPCGQFVSRIPIGFARQHHLLGLANSNGCLPVAVDRLDHLSALDVVSRRMGKPVRPVLMLNRSPSGGATSSDASLAADASDLQTAINDAYRRQEGGAERFLADLDRKQILAEVSELAPREDLLDTANRAPVIRLVNLVLFEAVQQQASDVHIQPYESRLVVRMRIDGVLADVFDLPKHLQEEITSRVKIMGRMNIAEKRLAQDGRATVQVGDRPVDLRLSTLPTNFGERVVIRLLDKSAQLLSLEQIGMEEAIQRHFRQLIGIEHGIILVTGPTGSGKTTTLYAALQAIDSRRHNVLTLEDPIEYQLPGISQTQVSTKKGMTFASGLRSVLRQDPDVIMVGEIRDRETAVMAVQSALTGHLVFSTLHTNDAASTITRLLDLGIEPYLVASSVVGVLAQRLVRRVCRRCGRSYEPPESELRLLGLTPSDVSSNGFARGDGCAECRQTGYRGRIGLFELLTVNDALRELIQHRAAAAQITRAAVAGGMTTLRSSGVNRVLSRVTTVEEVERVTMRDTDWAQ